MTRPIQLEIDEHTYLCFEAYAKSHNIDLERAMVISFDSTAQFFGDLSGIKIGRDVSHASEQLELPLENHPSTG